MSIFKNLMEGIGLRKPDYGRLNVEVPKFNTQPTMDRIKALEAKVDAPITGVSQAGAAAQDAARQSFEEQAQRGQQAAASNAATRAATQGIFGGMSSGSMERSQRQAGQEAAEAQQAQAGEAARTMSSLAASDIESQQDFQNQGLMQLPSMLQGLESARVNTELGGIESKLDQQRTNLSLGQQERSARKRALGGFGSMLFGKGGSALSLFG